ncbi:MAG: hypothetical protein HN509_01610 [Halobacteriovoraceae bacterium]|jgi:hypothetical protein|nr:hypothetical protein [Halobacteriovoraceae bacterium]MBT5095785.1 hypothetical protein [Halobacteriovoraceae bacterium]
MKKILVVLFLALSSPVFCQNGDTGGGPKTVKFHKTSRNFEIGDFKLVGGEEGKAKLVIEYQKRVNFNIQNIFHRYGTRSNQGQLGVDFSEQPVRYTFNEAEIHIETKELSPRVIEELGKRKYRWLVGKSKAKKLAAEIYKLQIRQTVQDELQTLKVIEK